MRRVSITSKAMIILIMLTAGLTFFTFSYALSVRYRASNDLPGAAIVSIPCDAFVMFLILGRKHLRSEFTFDATDVLSELATLPAIILYWVGAAFSEDLLMPALTLQVGLAGSSMAIRRVLRRPLIVYSKFKG